MGLSNLYQFFTVFLPYSYLYPLPSPCRAIPPDLTKGDGMSTKGSGRKPTKATKATTTKARRTGRTKAQVLASVAKAGETNARKGAKAHYRNDILAGAVAKATTKASLTEAGLAKAGKVGRTPADAKARREFARKVGAPVVDVADIVHANKDGEILHDRPENLVRVRLATIAKAMGKGHRFYAIRTEPYSPDTVPAVFIVRL